MSLDAVLDHTSSVGINQHNHGVRFTLKKRSIRNSKEMVNLSPCNSAFLSGLFADVAKAAVLSDLQIPQKRSSEIFTTDVSYDDACSPAPAKKSRTSFKKCFSRARESTMNLTVLGEALSPTGINEFFEPGQNKETRGVRNPFDTQRQDSLAFQLNCVSGDTEIDPSSTNKLAIGDAAKLAFPNLPATVSDSSCNAGLTRANLVRQVSTPETHNKESFGWFVDLDDHQTVEARASLPYAVSSDSLAFQAPTAPKRVNDEAELEWAQAADTVDDVLGDFF